MKWKYGKEQPPADVKAKTIDEVLTEEELIKKAKVGYEKNAGDTVNQGETVVILEAMKMENSLPAP